MHHIRFRQLLAIAVNHSVTQMNAIAGDTDDPLNYIKVRGTWIDGQEHDDVSPMYLGVWDNGHPVARRRKLYPVHEHVIAD